MVASHSHHILLACHRPLVSTLYDDNLLVCHHGLSTEGLCHLALHPQRPNPGASFPTLEVHLVSKGERGCAESRIFDKEESFRRYLEKPLALGSPLDVHRL